MATSRRRNIVNYIKSQILLIDGQTSTFDPSYTYVNNLFGNVFRRIKFIDEINDFPSVYLQAGTETRTYQSYSLVEASLPIAIRIYVKGSSPKEQLDTINEDIEHVIYSLSSNPSLGIKDIIIDNISTDEGLLDPYGIGEIFITVSYLIID